MVDKREEVSETVKRKIIIASTGTETLICINGKVYSDHIDRIEFTHEGGEVAEIRLMVSDLPLEGETVGDGFRNFINSLLAPADEAQEQRIKGLFEKSSLI